MRNFTKSSGNALKKKSIQNGHFFGTKQTKKQTDKISRKIYLQKKQISTKIEIPGFVVSGMAVTITGKKLNHRATGTQPTKTNRQGIVRKTPTPVCKKKPEGFEPQVFAI